MSSCFISANHSTKYLPYLFTMYQYHVWNAESSLCVEKQHCARPARDENGHALNFDDCYWGSNNRLKV